MAMPLLNRRFVLEAKDSQPDGQGGFDLTWTSLGTLWGELRGMTGQDRDREGAALALASYRVTLRSAAPGSQQRPEAGQRLRDGSRIFEILAVVDRDVEGRWLTCFCREEAVR